jgi:transposase
VWIGSARRRASNDDWTYPHDRDAKITKMKDGRTHLAHKAEHVVDLETGAIVGVTVQDADDGDTATKKPAYLGRIQR